MVSEGQITGLVAKLITDDELVLNVGATHGVKVDQIYAVLDPRTQDVRDPKTGNVLGSIDRIKVRVAIVQVEDHLSLARVFGRNSGLSGAAQVLAGTVPSRLSDGGWREGVSVGDPVKSTGRVVRRKAE